MKEKHILKTEGSAKSGVHVRGMPGEERQNLFPWQRWKRYALAPGNNNPKVAPTRFYGLAAARNGPGVGKNNPEAGNKHSTAGRYYTVTGSNGSVNRRMEFSTEKNSPSFGRDGPTFGRNRPLHERDGPLSASKGFTTTRSVACNVV